MRILVTGGAGFIGSALVHHLVLKTPHEVLVFDKLTYAGRLTSLAAVSDHPQYRFLQGDIAHPETVAKAFGQYQPDAVVHLAAESHVDRSIDGPMAFIQTNVVGTAVLLEQALAYWQGLTEPARSAFRFHHVSTDEVFGSLGAIGRFDETTAYDPRSPYAASKASSDHLVRAWGHTFGLPVLITNCSNNYGPRQFPEKLIPTMILGALAGRALPIYGDGLHVRDWLYVEDHVRAILAVLERGALQRTYAVGGNAERTTLEIARAVCRAIDEVLPPEYGAPRHRLIRHVKDRPGHDRRYAIDGARIQDELGWRPEISFEAGMRMTIQWYLENQSWWQDIDDQNSARLGLGDNSPS